MMQNKTKRARSQERLSKITSKIFNSKNFAYHRFSDRGRLEKKNSVLKVQSYTTRLLE